MKTLFGFLMLNIMIPATSSADSFTKVQPVQNILNESKTSIIATEVSLQPIRSRSTDMLRFMLGTTINTKSIGPSLQGEWSTRISRNSPFYASTGIGYQLETKQNNEGADRNFHQLPIFVNFGHTSKLTKSWKASLAAGPVVRQTFERGNAREQNSTYAYGDLIGSIGVEYEWLSGLTGTGHAIGLRVTRMFGLPNTNLALPTDTFLAGFAFDL